MINIIRDRTTPASLETPEIQKYIEDLHGHLADPKNIPKPKAQAYRNSDLLSAFDKCFYSKCYLTEQKFANSWCMDVEHFISQTEDSTLRFTWSNLYPAEHRANSMKPRATPPGGYLDPCNPMDDVELEIMYFIGPFGQSVSFDPTDPNNQKAKNTAHLLDIIHNGHDENTIKSTASLRLEIQKKYDIILHLIIDWLASEEKSTKKNNYKKQLEEHLSKKSSFTMLFRSMPAVINHIPSEMLD